MNKPKMLDGIAARAQLVVTVFGAAQTDNLSNSWPPPPGRKPKVYYTASCLSLIVLTDASAGSLATLPTNPSANRADEPVDEHRGKPNGEDACP
jgi:hypothetical protein